MSIKLRLCPNNTTYWLHETFKATPLSIPEARVQPLMIVAKAGNKTHMRGELKYFFKGTPSFSFPFEEDTVANASLDRTTSIGMDVGLKILEGFLQGLKMSAAPIGIALKGVNEISFSFTNVKRRWADINHLGTAIRGLTVDPDHPSLGIFLGDEAAEMLLITDIITSKSFTINHEKGKENAFELGIPAINEYLTDLKSSVKVKSNNKKTITFEGEEYLTFAFSCIRLEFEAITGAIRLMEAITMRKISRDFPPSAVGSPLEPHLFNENVGMIIWD